MFDENEGGTTLMPLIDRLANGDTSAAEEIIKHSMERLRLLAHKRLLSFPDVRGRQETDDVVQHAALKLYRALKADAPTSPGHLMRLASTQIRRVLLDMKRHEVGVGEDRVKVVLDPAQATSQVGRIFDQPDKAAKEKEKKRMRLQEIDEQVENLPEDQRDVFQQVYYQGLPYGDVARALEISESTVKRRWYDAQDKLHQLIGQDQ